MPVWRRRESEGRDRDLVPSFSYNRCEPSHVRNKSHRVFLCTVFGFYLLIARAGVYRRFCQWYRVCDAGALRAEPLGHPYILRLKKKQKTAS